MPRWTYAATLLFTLTVVPVHGQTLTADQLFKNTLPSVSQIGCRPDSNPSVTGTCCGSPGQWGCFNTYSPACVGPSWDVLHSNLPYTVAILCNLDDPTPDTTIGKTAGGANDTTFFFTSDLHPFRGTGNAAFNSPIILKHVASMNSWATSGQSWPAGSQIPGAIPAPRALVVGGDLGTGASAADLGVVRSLYEQGALNESIQLPVIWGMGNHDAYTSFDTAAAENRMWDYMATRMQAFNPDYNLSNDTGSGNYSWDWGNTHMVMLHLWAADNCGKQDHVGTGAVRTAGLTWLANDLATNVGASGRPVIFFQHFGVSAVNQPSQSRSDDCQYSWSLEDYTDFWNAVRDYNVIGMFTGHSHYASVNRPDSCINGAKIPNYCSASSKFPPTTDTKGRPKFLDDFENSSAGDWNGIDDEAGFIVARVTDNYLDVASVAAFLTGGAADYLNPTDGRGWYTNSQNGCRKRINGRFIDITSLFQTRFGSPAAITKTSPLTLTGEIAVPLYGLNSWDYVDTCTNGSTYHILTATEMATLNAGGTVTLAGGTSNTTGTIFAVPPKKAAIPNTIDLTATVAAYPGPQLIDFYGPPNTAFTLALHQNSGEGPWLVLNQTSGTFDPFGHTQVYFHLDPYQFQTITSHTTVASITVNTSDEADSVSADVSLNVKQPMSVTFNINPPDFYSSGASPLFTAGFAYTVYSDSLGNNYKPTGNAALYWLKSDGTLQQLSIAPLNASTCHTDDDKNPQPFNTIVFGNPATGNQCPTQVDKTSNTNIFQFPANPALPTGQYVLFVRYNPDNSDGFFAQADSETWTYYYGASRVTELSFNVLGTVSVGVGGTLSGLSVVTTPAALGDVPVTVTIAPVSGAAYAAFNSPNGPTLIQLLTTDANNPPSATVPTIYANTVTGNYIVTASSPNLVGVTRPFTNIAGPVANLSFAEQSLSAVAGTALPAVKVQVSDAFGNPASGQTVQIDVTPAANGATALPAQTLAVSDATGIATATLTAGSIAGSYTVVADYGSISTPSLPVTNLPPPPASFTAVSAPSGVVVGFAFPLKVQAIDQFGHSVPNAPVTFTAPTTGASAAIVGSPATSDANGYASVTATANTIAGLYSIIVTSGAASASINITNTPGPPASLSPLANSTPQSTAVNTSFTQPLAVTVLDSYQNPIQGATVTFTAPGSGASAMLSPPGASGSAGIASTNAVANTVAGAYTVTANVTGSSAAATFSLTNNAGAPAFITSNGSQSAAVGQGFPNPLQVTVTDPYNNPVPGVTVTFQAPSSGATAALAATTATTDTHGNAKVTATAGTAPGSYSVAASVIGPHTVNIALTNTVGAPASVTATAGGGQSVTVGHVFAALQATVKDIFGNPVPAYTVTVTAPISGASVNFPIGSNLTTNAAGVATVLVDANNVAGSYSVSVSAGTAIANFSLTNLAGAPATLTATNGGGQSVAVGQPFAAIQATVRDGFGNPVAGAIATFAVPTSGASAVLGTPSGSNGTTTVGLTANTIPGSYSVTASYGSLPQVSFPMTNLTGPPATITATEGSGQSANVGQSFANSLQAIVKDSFGNPVFGTLVTFTAPASGASFNVSGGTIALPTNMSGLVAFAVQPNTVAGSYTVTASDGSATVATFSMTNHAGAPATLTATSGGGQSVAVGKPFAAIQATVMDSYGNPVPGAIVNFTAPTSGPSAAVGIRNATTGTTTLALTANTIAGSYTVTGSFGSLPQVSFPLTNLAGPPATITATAGSGQSVAVGQSLANPLQATVNDSYGNPVFDTLVTFTAPVSGASLANTSMTTSAPTNMAGVASLSTTANTVAGPYTVTASDGSATAATFSLTNVAGPPAVINTAGSGQSAIVGQAFASPLQATVTDAYGNLLPTAKVVFIVPPGGASATPGGSTTANGATTVPMVANQVAGSYTVTANSGTASATYNLVNLAGPPQNLTLSGTLQTAGAGSTFALPLAVMVNDVYNNPVPNVTVAFSAPVSGASGSFVPPAGFMVGTTAGQIPTNSQGIAALSFIANTTGGTYLVTVSTTSGNLSAEFQLTNLGPIPTSPSDPTVQETVQTTTVSVGFSNVSAGGGTTITPVDPSTLTGAPGEYAITDTNSAFEIQTSATYSGPITICFSVPSVPDPAIFATVRILHYTGGGWVDQTILIGPNAPNFTNKTVCSQSASLSPFLIVKALGPIAKLSATALAFGQQTLLSTATQSFTVTNPGISPLSVTGIVINGGNAGDFSETNNCQTLAVAASCSVNVTFAPSAIGGRASALVIADNDGGNSGSTQSVALIGEGAAIGQLPRLGIVKSHTGYLIQGEMGATYSITVNNAADAGISSGTVTVTDNVPAGLALVSMAGSGWTCPANGPPCTRADSLAPGGAYPSITVTVNVAIDAPATVTNQASVSGGGSTTASTADPGTVKTVCAGASNVTLGDIQSVINEALGVAPPMDFLAHNGFIGVADIQIAMNAALGFGCRQN